MKKLMIALAAAATTMFSFGDLPTGTSFEAFSVGPKTVGDIAKTDDTGNQDGADKYWSSTAPEADELGAITNDVAGQGVSRPDMFLNSTQSKSLFIDTSAPLVRAALPSSSESQSVAIGDGIYLDTLVKFTAADEAFAENLTEGDKIAIEYVEHEAEEGDEGYTNFVIRAGFVGGSEIVQTNYFAAVPDGFNKDVWHRLTVRTIADVGDGNVGFVIYLDGDMTKTLEYPKTVDAGFGELNALAQTFYNSEKHALFPSAVNSGDNKLTISSVAFSGSGFIDDVSFTATKPSFINEAIRVTIEWDEHVTGMTINNTVLTAEQVAAKSWTGEPNEGSVVAVPTFETGYVAGAPVLPAGATYDSETKTFGNLTAGMTCTIKSMFPLYEVNGVSFDDLGEALTAAAAGTDQAPATLKLLADCNQALNFTEGYIVLDLAGCDIQGNGSDFSIGNSGATLIITNSGAEASILIPADNGAGAEGTGTLLAAAGFTTIQAGTFEGIILTAADDDTTFAQDFVGITGGKFLFTGYDAEDPTTFYLYPCVAQGLDLTQDGDYVVVGTAAPQPTTFKLTTTGGANAEITTNPADVSALTEATDVTITATATNGFTYATVDLDGTDWTYNSLTDAISMTTNISENTTVEVPDAVSEQQSGYDSGDGEHTFVIDSATEDELEDNLPTGKTLASPVSEGSSLTYAQAYALGLWDATATTVTDLDATISVAADGKVTVTLANAPTTGYLVQCKVYEKASLTAEWSTDPVATYAYGSEQAFTPGSATAGFYKVAVVITNSLQQ